MMMETVASMVNELSSIFSSNIETQHDGGSVFSLSEHVVYNPLTKTTSTKCVRCEQTLNLTRRDA